MSTAQEIYESISNAERCADALLKYAQDLEAALMLPKVGESGAACRKARETVGSSEPMPGTYNAAGVRIV